jgi:hypothetical protein
MNDEFYEACSGSEIEVPFGEVFGLPKCGDVFYFVAVDPIIPWRVALQQSPPLFHWTIRI